jgi:hypothetical protein
MCVGDMNKRRVLLTVLLVSLSATAQAHDVVTSSSAAIRIAQKLCVHAESEFTRGWHWSARRHGEYWRAYFSKDGVERYCNYISLKVNAHDGSLIRPAAPANIEACVYCFH